MGRDQAASTIARPSPRPRQPGCTRTTWTALRTRRSPCNHGCTSARPASQGLPCYFRDLRAPRSLSASEPKPSDVAPSVRSVYARTSAASFAS